MFFPQKMVANRNCSCKIFKTANPSNLCGSQIWCHRHEQHQSTGRVDITATVRANKHQLYADNKSRVREIKLRKKE